MTACLSRVGSGSTLDAGRSKIQYFGRCQNVRLFLVFFAEGATIFSTYFSDILNALEIYFTFFSTSLHTFAMFKLCLYIFRTEESKAESNVDELIRASLNFSVARATERKKEADYFQSLMRLRCKPLRCAPSSPADRE